MLIPSHRHTAADLREWERYEEADRVHAGCGKLAKHMESAFASITTFVESLADADRPYASVSWGKDSLVLAHLLSVACPWMPLFHIRQSNELPETLQVRDAYLGSSKQSYSEATVVYERSPDEDAKFFAAFKTAGNKHLSGVRAQESRGRRMRMLTHGENTENTCAPIGWWNAQDVFAYLSLFNLPVHPSYAMLGGGRWKRDHLRVEGVGASGGAGMGRTEWEREYYGDVLRRLEAVR